MPLKLLRNISLALCLGAISLLSSGCLLRASTEDIPATAVAQNLPTLTPTPTETLVEPTPEPQITTVVITATPDETLLAAQATADALATLDAQITAVAQLDVTLDPIIIQITETVAASTQVWVDLTLTAQFQPVLPSLTPTPEEFVQQPTPTLDSVIVQPVGSDCTHVVSVGENLFRIGLRYGVGYQTIANYNGIANPALISIGQQIQIPNCGQGTTTADGFNTAESGGTFDSGVGGTAIGVGGVCGDVYIVEQYETLFGISMKCNVLIRDILALNSDKISDPDRIYYRQELRLR